MQINQYSSTDIFDLFTVQIVFIFGGTPFGIAVAIDRDAKQNHSEDQPVTDVQTDAVNMVNRVHKGNRHCTNFDFVHVHSSFCYCSIPKTIMRQGKRR